MASYAVGRAFASVLKLHSNVGIGEPSLEYSLVNQTTPFPQRWMYCITSTGKGGSGHSCTVCLANIGMWI